METQNISSPSRPARPRQAAFSLVEVTLAVGIVAFAFVAIFGLMPVGMTTFRKAVDTSVGAQIAQVVVNDAQQSDFDQLIAAPTPPTRYFDNQGIELTASTGAIYLVNTRIIPATTLPDTAAETNVDLATVSVQVAHDPGLAVPAADSNGLWLGTGGIPVTTYSAFVARNSPQASSSP